MEADTPPLEGLPQTKSTTSLFNSDMTTYTKMGQARSVEANLLALSEVDSPLLPAGRACGIGHKLPVWHDTVWL